MTRKEGKKRGIRDYISGFVRLKVTRFERKIELSSPFDTHARSKILHIYIVTTEIELFSLSLSHFLSFVCFTRKFRISRVYIIPENSRRVFAALEHSPIRAGFQSIKTPPRLYRMQKKDGSVSGESSRMERPIKLVIDGSPSHQRRAQTHRIGNVGHTRVSRDRGICSSSFAEFTSHRKSHYFRVSIRVEAAPPSPPSSLPSRIIQHHHLYSSLISRRIFVQIRSEIC